MTDLNEALNQEANVLPEKQAKIRPYTYVVLKKSSTTGDRVFVGEFGTRGELADYLEKHCLGVLDAVTVYKSTGVVPIQEKRVVSFSL